MKYFCVLIVLSYLTVSSKAQLFDFLETGSTKKEIAKPDKSLFNVIQSNPSERILPKSALKTVLSKQIQYKKVQPKQLSPKQDQTELKQVTSAKLIDETLIDKQEAIIKKLNENKLRIIKAQEMEIKQLEAEFSKLQSKTHVLEDIQATSSTIPNSTKKLNELNHKIEKLEILKADISKLDSKYHKIEKKIKINNQSYNEKSQELRNFYMKLRSAQVEDKLLSSALASKQLIVNTVRISDTTISDNILEFDDDFQFRVKNKNIPLAPLIEQINYLQELTESCGGKLERCMITNTEFDQTQEKEKMIFKSLKVIKKHLKQVNKKNLP